MDHDTRVEQLEIEKDDLDILVKEVRSRIDMLEQRVYDYTADDFTPTKRLHSELSLLVSDLGQSLSRSEAPSRCSVTQESSDGSVKLRSRCAAVWDSTASDTIDSHLDNNESFHSDLDIFGTNENESKLGTSCFSGSTSTLASATSSEATTVVPASQLNKATAKSRSRGRGHGSRVFRNSSGVYPNLNAVGQDSSTGIPIVVQESTKTLKQTYSMPATLEVCSTGKPSSLVKGDLLSIADNGIKSGEPLVSTPAAAADLKVSQKATATCSTSFSDSSPSSSKIRVRLSCNHEYESNSTDFVQLLQICKQCSDDSDIDESLQDPFSHKANFLVPDALRKIWRRFLLDMVAEAGRRTIKQAVQLPNFKEIFEQYRAVPPHDNTISELRKALTETTDSSNKKVSDYVLLLTELFRELFSLTGYRSCFITNQLKVLKEKIELPVLQILCTRFVIKCFSRSVLETKELRLLFLQPALDANRSICYRFVVYLLMHVNKIILDCDGSERTKLLTWLEIKCFPSLRAASKNPGFSTKTREYIHLYSDILKTKLQVCSVDNYETTAEIPAIQPKPKPTDRQSPPCVVQAQARTVQHRQEDHIVLTPSYLRHFSDEFEQNKSTDLRSLHAFIKSHFVSKKAVYVRNFISTAFNCAFTLDNQRQASSIGTILSYMIELGIVTKEKVIEVFCADALPVYLYKLAGEASHVSSIELGVTIVVKALFRSSENFSWIAKISIGVTLDDITSWEKLARMMLTRSSERYPLYFLTKLRHTSSKDRNLIGRQLCKSFMEEKP